MSDSKGKGCPVDHKLLQEQQMAQSQARGELSGEPKTYSET